MTPSNPAAPVVVGVDWDPASIDAVRWAADYAAAAQRPLVLLHATLWNTVNAPYGLAPPPRDFEEPEGSATELMEKTLEAVRTEHPDVDVDTALRTVSPVAALLTASQHAHLVVVGRRRAAGRVLRLLLGEVGTHVATHAATSVVVVRDHHGDGVPAPIVLVGYDGSPAAEAALAFGLDEASRRGWELTVLHAVPSPNPDDIERGRRWLAEAVRRSCAGHPDVAVTLHNVHGHPADTLTAGAATAGLVVVGDRGQGGFAGLRLGSVAQALLQHSDQTIAIIRASY